MNFEYSMARKLELQPYVFIRLKYQRKYYHCEYYDGMRILSDSIPEGKHRYETRHPDGDVSYPISVASEGSPVIVNFCGSIVSDIPIPIGDEKRIMEILYQGDSREEHAKANCHNPI